MGPGAPPRICLDGRNLLLPHGTGVARHGASVIAACRHLGLRPKLVVDRPPTAAHAPARGRRNTLLRLLRAAAPALELRQLPPCPTELPMLRSPDLFRVAQVHFNLYRRPLRLHAISPPAVMHWNHPLPMHLAGVPNLVTIHDLIPLLHPDLTSIDGARLRRILHTILRQAARILTVSETVRHQIIALLGIRPDRVVNLSQPCHLPEALLCEAATAPRICPPGSLLCIGTVTRRKNIRRLVEAHRKSGVAARLVIIGPDGPDAATELAQADGNASETCAWLESRTGRDSSAWHNGLAFAPPLWDGPRLDALRNRLAGRTTPPVASPREWVATITPTTGVSLAA